MSENWENRAARPSVCRNCGAIVAAGESTCPQCGVALAARASVAPRVPRYDRETARFVTALFSRSVTFTIVFLAANLFVFLLMWDTSRSLWLFDGETLVRYGAKINSLIDHQHQWWRFVTPVFDHGGLIHILFNMYGLWILGPYVERLYGSSKFVVIWVVTGVAGVVASYLTVQPSLSHGFLMSRIFKSGDPASVGASGALFGLIGVLFVFGLKYRNELPEGFKRAFGTGMLPTILINLFIGFSVPVIDNAAHLGGLFAGALIALGIDYQRPGPRTSMKSMWNVLQVLCLLLVLVSFIQVFRHFNDPIPAELLNDAEGTSVPTEGTRTFTKAMNDGEQELESVLKSDDLSGVDAVIRELDSAPALDAASGELKDQLKAGLQRARQARDIEKQNPAEAKRQLEGVANDYDKWLSRRDKWVATKGKSFGLFLRKDKQEKNEK